MLRDLLTRRQWPRRAIIAIAVVAISLQWVNSRVRIFHIDQAPPSQVVPGAYFLYRSMAAGFRHGRVGQIDLAVVERPGALSDPWTPYEQLPPDVPHRWVNFYVLDIGYSFIVEAARLAFPSLPDNYLRPLALQLVADALLVCFVFFTFSQWHIGLGLFAAYLYTLNGVFYELVSFPFYYYWDIPVAFIVLGSMLLAYRRPAEAGVWLTVAAAALGFGVWLRGSWWPIGFFLFGVAVLTPELRKRLLIPSLVFALLAAPQVARASYARGRLTVSTRTVWHVALVGLGYDANPYGLEPKDEAVFKLTREKYGVTYQLEDYWAHDQAAKREVVSIWQKDPGFVIRSILRRLGASVSGSIATISLSFLPNLAYRVLCLFGVVAMIVRGGDRRLMGLAAAGTYTVYVVLTCMFYWVSPAYDNVSQVALFFMLMGLCDAALHGAGRLLLMLPVVPRVSRAVAAD